MKTYDFDRIVDRHGTNAVKYDTLTDVFGSKELLPLWVADMDFATPDFILDALRRRLDHPVLGYTQLPDDYWPQIAVWIEARHGWRPDPAWMRFIPGIVKGIGMAVLALTRPGDKVVIQPPVYHPFRLVPEQMGRRVVCNPLRRTGDRYEMDFEQLEALLDDDCRLLLLSNPHNPAGIVWPEETLRRLAAICDRRGIVVVSDEIHCDMALYGHRHRPFASVSDAAAHCSAAFSAGSKRVSSTRRPCSRSSLPGRLSRPKATHGGGRCCGTSRRTSTSPTTSCGDTFPASGRSAPKRRSSSGSTAGNWGWPTMRSSTSSSHAPDWRSTTARCSAPAAKDTCG